MQETEINPLLRKLDPTSDDQFEGFSESDAASELLALITAEPVRQRPRARRRFVATAAAATFAFGVVTGVAALQPDARSASAAIQDAAEIAAKASSGQVDVAVELTMLPPGETTPSGSRVQASLTFDGPDFDLDNEAFLSGDGEAMRSRVIYLDGVENVQDGDGPWVETRTDSSAFMVGEPGTGASALGELLAGADDFTETDDEDGVETYAGTIARSAFDEVDPTTLPVGMQMLFGPPTPETVQVEVTLADGALRTVSFRLVGEVANYGFVDVSSRSTYSELNEPQVIEAP